MDKTKSYLVYCPPKSNSLGHGVRDKNVNRATQKVIANFVRTFKAKTDNKLELTLYYNKEIETEKANQTIEKLKQFLGPSEREWDNTVYEYMDNSITWECDEMNILDVLDYVDKLKGDNYLPLSKYWISSFYHYGANVEPHGTLMCSVESGRLFIRLYLIIPYSIDEGKCLKLLSKFQTHLPFKLNPKHFRRLGPSKRGYGQWKLDEKTLDRLNESLVALQSK